MESKHHKLARSLHSGPTDRDMKPDAKTRDQLNVSFNCIILNDKGIKPDAKITLCTLFYRENLKLSSLNI